MNDSAEAYRDRRVLVTGAGGYLANRLLSRLSRAGCGILRWSRPGRRLPDLPGAEPDVHGELADVDSWTAALRGIDTVFHLAAQTSVYAADRHPLADLRANVEPMVALLEGARRSGVRPGVVFTSTSTVAGIPASIPVGDSTPDRPVTVYDLHKQMAESHLAHFSRTGSANGVALRLTNVYGPGPRSGSADRGMLNSMIQRAVAGETLTVYGGGTNVRDFVHVHDVVEALLLSGARAADLGPEPFVLGSGEGHTIREALELVARLATERTGRPVAVESVPFPHPPSPIEARNFVADSSRFSAATGWRPRFRLEGGIRETMGAMP